MEIFESQIRHKKSAHESTSHTHRRKEREREGASLERSALSFSLSLSVSVSLFLSLFVRVCSCEIYKKRDVSIDDDDQQRGTTRERRRRRNKSPETSHRARERMPPLAEPTPRDSLPRGHLPKRPGEISRREHRGGEESVDDWEDFERGDGKSSRSKEAFRDGCVYIIIRDMLGLLTQNIYIFSLSLSHFSYA